MQIRIYLAFILFVFGVYNIQAQDDPVLFSIGDTEVGVSEFKYIYSKTNGAKADFSKNSLEEYLDLYVKFKLKVQKARDMQIDTIPALQRELDGYRKQLSNSYLIDKEVKERLLREAYKRTKEDVNVSHIMVTIKGRKTDEDTLKAYNQVMDIYKQLEEGADFGRLAMSSSEDAYSKKEGGKIGWLTAVLPNGFYNMETAAYVTPIGKYSKPFRTNMGYHILQVNERRPARGSIEVAHIVIREDAKNPAKNAQAMIQAVHAKLKAGGDFDQLARENSDDKKSAVKGGYIGFFGIGVNEPAFEEAAFGLKEDGDYSVPVKTSAGWHIIRRVSRPGIGAYESEKNRLQVKVERDARFEEARTEMIRKIKASGDYKVEGKVLEEFIATLEEDFLTGKWKAPKKSPTPLFSLGGKAEYTLGDYTDYLVMSRGQRARLGRTNDIATTARLMLEEFSDKKALDYEKSRLSEKYPDFRSLMREYEEGILLFEATKMLVWDKASQDTTGLQAFYQKNQGDYLWGERAKVSIYTIQSESPKILAKVKKMAKKKSSEKVLKKVNKAGNLLTVTTGKVEKGKNKHEGLDDLEWKKGAMTEGTLNSDNTQSFVKIEEVLPREQKELKEARGYVIADYQDQLEAEWIEQLRKEYPVKINQAVLDSLVK
jgi:peptidyl-prolyl cis-trans isomerase SurA